MGQPAGNLDFLPKTLLRSLVGTGQHDFQRDAARVDRVIGLVDCRGATAPDLAGDVEASDALAYERLHGYP